MTHSYPNSNQFQPVMDSLEQLAEAQIELAGLAKAVVKTMDSLTQEMSVNYQTMQGADEYPSKVVEAQQAIAINLERLTDAQARLVQHIEKLARNQSRIINVQEWCIEEIEENLASSTAGIAHLERVVDYLLRRDQERQG